MHHADIFLKNKVITISGSLHFANVMSVYEKSLKLLTNLPEYHFDFLGITSSDSSGLALIVEWLAIAKRQHKKIILHDIPKQLLAIAKAARLDEIILNVSA